MQVGRDSVTKWLPLPKIAHGIVIYPFSPSPNLNAQSSASGQTSATTSLTPTSSRPNTAYSTIQSPLLSPFTDDGSVVSGNSVPTSPVPEAIKQSDLNALIPLEVGDEVFIIEQQKSWYRGYVLRALSYGELPSTAPIGCFPKNHVHIKGYVRVPSLKPEKIRLSVAVDPMDTNIIPDVEPVGSPESTSSMLSYMAARPPKLPRSLSESNITTKASSKKPIPDETIDEGEIEILRSGSTTGMSYLSPSNFLSSLDLAETNHSQHERQKSEPARLPPLPFTRYSQSTATGESEPLIDEIAACIREWNCRLYKHLSERRYAAFNALKDQINYLFQARRQLLDQTLSREELSRLRKELIHRMVVINVIQGGEMLLRHPNVGHLLDLHNTSIATIYRMHFEYANKDLSTPNAQLTSNTLGSGLLSSTSTVKLPSPSIAALLLNSTSGLAELTENMQPASPGIIQPPSPLVLNTPGGTAKGAKFYHLYFDLKACVAHICQPGEYTELYFSLYNRADEKFLTEEFLVVMNYNGMPKDEGRIGKLNTLFTQISNHDLNKDIYLVCRIVRMGSMKLSDKDHASSLSGGQASIISGVTDSKSYFDIANGKQHQISLQHQLAQQRHMSQPVAPQPNNAQHGLRRPFGCAVLHLGGLLKGTSANQTLAPGPSSSAYVPSPNVHQTSTTMPPSSAGTPGLSIRTNLGTASSRDMLAAEHFMPIYTPTTESGYSCLINNIIDETPKEYERNPRAEMLCVYLRLFHGELDNVVKTNTGLLQDVPITSWLGFPDVVFPGDERNELYISLSSGDFSQMGRSKNVQVTVCVRSNITGDVIEDALHPGSGVGPTTYWESMVFYHDQRPSWEETIKVKIADAEIWEKSHVFLTVRHRSSSGYHSQQAQGSHGSLYRNQSGSPQGLASEKIVAFGFLPLFLPPVFQNFVVDGIHKLALYRYDKQLSNPGVYLSTVPWCVQSTAPANMSATNKQNHRLTMRHGSQSSIGSRNVVANGSNNSLGRQDTNHTGTIIVGSPIGISMHHAPSTGTSPPNNVKPVALRDTVTFQTFLCSTQYTQNQVLVQLLNWQSFFDRGNEGKQELQSVLDQFTFVGEMEIVKFLGDIFDALFGILTTNHMKRQDAQDMDDKVVEGIVWVLGIIQDRRFSNFRPVLDVYIEQLFAQSGSQTPGLSFGKSPPKEAYVYDALLKSHLRLCSDPADIVRAKKLRSSMKVWEYLFRFIVRSREVARQTEEESERTLRDMMFKEELQQLMKLINGIMSPELPSSMIGSQTLALQHFASILGELRRVFLPSEVSDIIINFLDASAHVTGKLVAYRLCTIIFVIKSPIFMDMDSKNSLVPKVVHWIECWIKPYSQVVKELDPASGKDGSVPPNLAIPLVSRAQWLENLRLSITIVYLMFEKVRGYRSMSHTSTSLSSSWVSSMFSLKSGTHIRPISLATHDEYDESHEDQMIAAEHEVAEITVTLLSLLPLLLSTYMELQVIVSQCYKAMLHPNSSSSSVTSPTSASSATSGKSPISSGRNSMSLRDRGNSVSSKVHTASALGFSGQTSSQAANNSQSIISKCPATPFPAVYPFPSVPALKNTGKISSLDVTPLISSGLSDISVIILELFNVVPSHEWKQYLINTVEEQGTGKASLIIREVCGVCLGLLQGEMINPEQDDETLQGMTSSTFEKIAAARAIPRHWLNLQMVAHQVVINSVLTPIIELIREGYFPLDSKAEAGYELEVNNNPMALWECVLRTIFTVVSSRELEIDRFLPQRQHAMWKLVGDLRGGSGVQALLNIWKAYGFDQQLPDIVDGNEEDEKTMDDDDDDLETSSEPDKTIDKNPEMETLMARSSVASMEEIQHRPSPLSIVTNVPLPNKLTIFHARATPLIVLPLCKMCLASHDHVREVASSMMIDLFVIEYKRTGNVMRLQQYLIGTMDHLLMVEKIGSPVSRHRLILDLQNSLQQHDGSINTECFELCTNAISSLATFLDLLLQIRSLPQDNDEYMDERINSTLKLMRFIQMIEREEIYIKYVHQLVQLQLESNNSVEAALTLKLHADLLEWDPYTELSAITELNFTAQTAFARKEKIYFKMLEYLERGKAWEICVDICKELAHQYEATTFDYIRLGEILSRQAGYIESIAKKERYYPEYFRVGYYGRGFPVSVRNHQVVFRGFEWEKISSFVERIQNKHPNAEVLPAKSNSGGSISDQELKELEASPDGQYLQITAVTPEPVREDRPIFNNQLVSDNIRSYYMANEVSRFSFSKPVLKPVVNPDDASSNKPENDFLNLWTEKTTLICEDSFPTILRRSRVIKTVVVELSPIENAVYAMEQKNNELAALERKYAQSIPKASKASQSSTNTNNINPFSMALNGAVDAPVNGGVPMYKMAFLSGTFAKQHPDMLEWVERLRDKIDDQVEILERCLEVHNKLVPLEMRPLHNNLVKFFRKNFKDEIQRVNLKRRMSQAASRASRNSKVLSATSLQEIIEKTPTNRQGSISPGLASAGGGSGNPKHGAMPPISRAFSIRPSSMILTGMDDNMQVTEEDFLMAGKKTSAASDVSSKAESLSRSFKMSLRMKSGRRRTSSNPDMMADIITNPPGQRSTKLSQKTTSSSSPSLLSGSSSGSKSTKKRTWAFSKPR